MRLGVRIYTIRLRIDWPILKSTPSCCIKETEHEKMRIYTFYIDSYIFSLGLNHSGYQK